jgi:hypothetical protein
LPERVATRVVGQEGDRDRERRQSLAFTMAEEIATHQ